MNGPFFHSNLQQFGAIHERNGSFFHRNPATHVFVQLRPCRRSFAPSTLPSVDLRGSRIQKAMGKAEDAETKMRNNIDNIFFWCIFDDGEECFVWLDSSDGSVHVSIAEFHGGDEPPKGEFTLGFRALLTIITKSGSHLFLCNEHFI